jgi:hypothetical protein
VKSGVCIGLFGALSNIAPSNFAPVSVALINTRADERSVLEIGNPPERGRAVIDDNVAVVLNREVSTRMHRRIGARRIGAACAQTEVTVGLHRHTIGRAQTSLLRTPLIGARPVEAEVGVGLEDQLDRAAG